MAYYYFFCLFFLIMVRTIAQRTNVNELIDEKFDEFKNDLISSIRDELLVVIKEIKSTLSEEIKKFTEDINLKLQQADSTIKVLQHVKNLKLENQHLQEISVLSFYRE